MKSRLLVLVLLAALLLTACEFSLAEDVTPPPGYISPTPPPTVGPLYPASPPNPQRGVDTYLEKCAPCHGPTGMGDGPQGRQLTVSVPPFGLPEFARGAAPADWYVIVTQGNLERFMPPFTSLTPEQRWDVIAYVYTLSSSPEELAEGAALYQVHCAACHGPRGEGSDTATAFTDQTIMAARSAQAMYQAISSGVPPAMPAFGGSLSEAERWALTAYLRTLSFAAPAAAAPTPEPSPTPEPPAETETPQAVETEEADNLTPVSEPGEDESDPLTPTPEAITAEGFGTVRGTVTNGTGGDLPDGLSITLLGFDPTMTGGFSEALTLSTPVGPDGSYVFNEVPLPPQRAYVVTLEYGGGEYTSDPAFVSPGQTEYVLSLVLYETSSDASVLSADRLHIFFDFSREGVVQVIEVYIITNPTLRTIVPAAPETPVLTFSLPPEAANLQFEGGVLGGRFIPTADGFGDTLQVLPGAGSYQVLFAFDLPYNRRLDFSHPLSINVNSALVMVPVGVRISSDLLVDSGEREFQGSLFTIYTSQPLPAGGTLEMSLSGTPRAASQPFDLDSRQSLLIGVGAFGLVLILAGVWLYLRDRRREAGEVDDLDDDREAGETAESLMDAVIALDDQFRSGAISEQVYRQRRAELKARLKELL
jgi:mono/diheme cytochrome c family protein